MDHDEQTIKNLAIKLCVDAGYDPYSPTCDVYFPNDPDCIYPWAGFRRLAKEKLDLSHEHSVVAKVKELTNQFSQIHSSDVRNIFLMLASEIDELKKVHAKSPTQTDNEPDWTDAIADEFMNTADSDGVAYTSRNSFDAALRKAEIRGYDLARNAFKNTKRKL
jgi:hypothetical protein